MRIHAAAPPASARVFAWLGAALFFVSLAYFVFSYAITFGVPAEGRERAPAVTWNVLLFTLFAFHHSLFARTPFRAWVARTLPAPLERSCYVWIASVLFLAVCALWRPVPGVAWQAEGLMVWALRLLQVAGIWITIRSAAILDIRELAGVTQVDDRSPGAPDETRPADVFRTTGPYGWVRHPIYSGWFLMVLAASPMTMTRLVFAIVSCAYLLIAMPFEERSMRASASGAYERYMAQVRWRLLPGVY